MKRGLLLLLSGVWVLGAVSVVPATARVNVDINLGPPVITFDQEPHVVLVPQSRVYYVPDVSDYDMYRYGSNWYINRGGRWYWSARFGGPFEAIELGRVPRPIYVVPRPYRHHWKPWHRDSYHHDGHHHGDDGHHHH